MTRQTQRFSGKTLETAVLDAINQLGEDAEILDARRVRRGGVAGFFASETYVVTARGAERRHAVRPAPVSAGARAAAAPTAAAPTAAPPEPAVVAGASVFEAHLRELVNAVEAQEQVADRVRPAAVPRTPLAAPAPQRVSPLPRFFSDDDLVPIAAPRPRPVQEPLVHEPLVHEPLVHTTVAAPAAPDEIDLRRPVQAEAAAWRPWNPAAETAPASAPRPASEVATVAAAPAPKHAWSQAETSVPDRRDRRADGPATRPATTSPVIDLRGPEGPQWSIENLAAIGVPTAIVERLPEDLDGDMAWTAAFEATVRALVPAPLDPRHAGSAITVSGPADAAPRLLQAALTGYPLGELQLGDRRVPATALELTLAIRSCLRS